VQREGTPSIDHMLQMVLSTSDSLRVSSGSPIISGNRSYYGKASSCTVCVVSQIVRDDRVPNNARFHSVSIELKRVLYNKKAVSYYYYYSPGSSNASLLLVSGRIPPWDLSL
jgi:hypothetical protein